jgi:predicted membrane channel-forming protein YqfA (hemolysin III family)
MPAIALTIAVLIMAVALPVILYQPLRKHAGRYPSYILAGVISICLVSGSIYLWKSANNASNIAYDIAYYLPIQLVVLFWGLVWLSINTFKFKMPQGPITRTSRVSLPAGRIEPVFSVGNDASTQPQSSEIDAIYDDPAPDEVKRNFFVRYWRGEFSLPFSFWIVGILLGLATILVVVALNRLLDANEYNPYTSFIFFISVLVFVVISTIWDVVGLWRSATRYMHRRWRQRRGTFWGGLVKLLLVGSVLGGITTFVRNDALQMRELYDIAFRGDPDLPDYSLRIMRNGTEIEIVGGFKYGLTNDFRRLLEASPQIAVVHLDSMGGRIGEAMQVHDLIQERGLVTYVVNQCFSACTLAFAGGRERWLGSVGKLGFHGPTFPGTAQEELNAAAVSQQQLLVGDGFDPYFVSRALSTPASELWTPTNQELFAGGAITNIAPPERFAISGLGAHLTLETSGDIVKAIAPTVAAIADRDPDAAKAIVQKFHEMYLYGNSMDETVDMIDERLDKEVEKYLMLADDETMLQFARLSADEYGHLFALDRTVCYKYISNQVTDVSDYLTLDLLEREIDLKSKIIRTAAQRLPASKASVQAGWQQVSQIMRAGPQRKNLVLFSTPPRPDQYGDYCQLYVALYEAILQLPPAKGAMIAREMLTGR